MEDNASDKLSLLPSHIQTGKFCGYVCIIALTSSSHRNDFENVSDLIMRYLTLENNTLFIGLEAKLK